MTKFKKFLLCSMTSALACTFVASNVVCGFADGRKQLTVLDNGQKLITDVTGKVRADLSEYYDTAVVQKLPDTVSENQVLSVIVKLEDTDSVLERFTAQTGRAKAKTVRDFASTREGVAASESIRAKSKKLQTELTKAGIDYELGSSYNVLLGGFEVLVKAKDFSLLESTLGTKATAIVGDEYERCEYQVVENDVNVHDTGIFNSAGSGYDGSGTVIAVLDTGLDYTHSAFSPTRFTGKDVLTTSSIASVLPDTSAASTSVGLTAADVYINNKVPFGYDYADKDSDVYPLESSHGTHVSGVIVGNDDTITGVAPNAQLCAMKVFSDDGQAGARTSWLLSALEDCVTLGVDVINMSLGTSAGFTREVDKENVSAIYDAIKEQGISLVAAASNDYNSTHASEKNGSLGLTSNPDSGTVGSPSTYEAALSVASISGVKTAYLTYGDTIIYFNESSDRASEPKNFVEEILPAGVDTKDFKFVTIPGVGRASDYAGYEDSVKGNIALVARGSTNFEEKARVAKEQGAAGCIIYNNVSGDISMTVGNTDFPVCSISQDNGELLKAAETGIITISRSQKAGPFMSDFSSWGPTNDLRIKPEITAHGGDILSAIPGQAYDRMSGTSMAAPNQAGVTALVRQYVKETFSDYTPTEVTATVNQILMSTADIAYNKNGLAFSVRKQGAGLANLTKATTSKAYLQTFDRESGEIMDKAKVELGDDAQKTGNYSLKFNIVNFGDAALSYDISAIVMTEGVSTTLTHQGDTTVTEEGYSLDGATVNVNSVNNATSVGNTVTVNGNTTASVTVQIVLGDKDKKYLDESFANGMYVEGFIRLTAKTEGGANLSVPYLAFYGDWTQAPLFDIDFFETNRDELDDAIDLLDKTLPDAYATRAVGGLYNDYITYLGAYPYTQNPAATKISADRKYISLSNQEGEDGTVNSIYAIWAGMLRGAKRMDFTITDDVTGEVIFSKTEYNQRKSFSSGLNVYPSSYDVDFNVADYNLKNNTKYTVTVQGYLDYDRDGANTNLKNTFSFPFVTDFEAPALTGVEFYTEYDRDARKNRLYANLSIYDNHYSAGAIFGRVTQDADGYALDSFGRYVTPIYSEFNSTSVVTYELTDHLDEIKNSHNGKSFVIQVMDYAQNTATYEINIPDTVTSVNFKEEDSSVTLSPNETYVLEPEIFPASSWIETLDYSSDDENIVRIVNGKLVAVASGTATVTAQSRSNPEVTAQLNVKVLAPDEPGYQRYDKPVADSFSLTGYTVDKVFYFSASEDRDLGAEEAGQFVAFTGNTYSLTMFPSESVTIQTKLANYFKRSDYKIEFISNNSNIVTVTEDGTIVAQREGMSSVSVRVLMNDRSTLYSNTISIEVKDPYTTNGPYLMSYMGLGGKVEIPEEFGVTEIYSYAFSNYHSVPKDENDEISEEDPYKTKIVPLGENTITEVVIPEGVEVIQSNAFAYLTALEKVTLPSTLTKISASSFVGCTSLRTVVGLENVQFVNVEAFKNCPLESVNLSKIVAIGDRAFAHDSEETSVLASVSLPASAQSIGAGAFYNNAHLSTVSIAADRVKLGGEAFYGCESLTEINVNASVIPSGVFDGCSHLTSVSLGKDVSVIGQYAFRGTRVSAFTVDPANETYASLENGKALTDKATGKTLLLVAPATESFTSSAIETVGEGAFSGNEVLRSVSLPSVTKLEAYAFADCNNLSSVTLGALTKLGDYAFYQTAVTQIPALDGSLKKIGDYAFFATPVASVVLGDGIEIGVNAFAACNRLTQVTLGNYVTVGDGAFQADVLKRGYLPVEYDSQTYYINDVVYDSRLTSVTIGNEAMIGNFAFFGAAGESTGLTTVTLGRGVSIGAYAFYDATSLANIDLRYVTSIGAYAFSGTVQYLYQEFQGQLENLGQYDFKAAPIEEVSLPSCTELGAYAFAGNQALQRVNLNGILRTVGEGAFYVCTNLAEVDLTGISYIGAGAFNSDYSLREVDLSDAVYVGLQAFANIYSESEEEEIGLTKVTLSVGATVDAGAFFGDELLTEVVNLNTVTQLGGSAFAGTSISGELSLPNVTFLGDFAFQNTDITSVTLGSGITMLGENPFAGCAITTYAREVNGTVQSDYNLGTVVRVIDGVLYRTCANGLELVSYPALRSDVSFTVTEGTVRIGDMAFAYNPYLHSVRFAWETAAVGDKAFFGCTELANVVFTSIQAPILEERYDESGYFNAVIDGYPGYIIFAPGLGTELRDGFFPGLEIVKFTMWNYLNDPTNYYYGANFLTYIGHPEHKQTAIVMVRPSNGTGYENFIYGQYFDVIVDGAPSCNATTKSVIELIDALPSEITLEDEAQVKAARAAYDAVTDYEQKGLITNISTLESAENIIRYLKTQLEPKPEPEPEPEPETDGTRNIIIACSVVGGVVVVILLATYIPKLVTLIRTKRNAKSGEEDDGNDGNGGQE